eukprot:2714548-Alexandrium_andersonii.AAC.1
MEEEDDADLFSTVEDTGWAASASDADMADFPQLGSESQEESRRRADGSQLSIPRAKSAKRASSSEGRQAQ